MRKLVAFRPGDGGQVELRRAMTMTERGAVEARALALREVLRPQGEDERAEVESALAAMLGGFRSMRQTGEDAEIVVAVLRAVLREFPSWAIERACLRIARRQAGLDPRWAPNDAEVVAVCEAVVADYRAALANAEDLLGGVVVPAPQSTGSAHRRPNKPEPKPALPGDGGHGARVAADLASRRARRESAEGETA